MLLNRSITLHSIIVEERTHPLSMHPISVFAESEEEDENDDQTSSSIPKIADSRTFPSGQVNMYVKNNENLFFSHLHFTISF